MYRYCIVITVYSNPERNFHQSCTFKLSNINFLKYKLCAGVASTYPEPKDKESFIKDQLYDYDYDHISAIPKTWDWPKISRP